jgi:hypothetical protein
MLRKLTWMDVLIRAILPPQEISEKNLELFQSLKTGCMCHWHQMGRVNGASLYPTMVKIAAYKKKLFSPNCLLCQDSETLP